MTSSASDCEKSLKKPSKVSWFGSLRRRKRAEQPSRLFSVQSALALNLSEQQGDLLRNSLSVPHLSGLKVDFSVRNSATLPPASTRRPRFLSKLKTSAKFGSSVTLNGYGSKHAARCPDPFDETPELSPDSSVFESSFRRKLTVAQDFEDCVHCSPVAADTPARTEKEVALRVRRVSTPTFGAVVEPRQSSFATYTLDRKKFVRKRSTIWYHTSHPDLNCSQLKDEIAHVTEEMDSMDNGEESKNAARAKQLSLGRKKFNMDPKKGIEFLVLQGLLQNTPQDIAAFLYRGEGLSKTAIGDYLGEKSPFHEQVLKAFVDLHDFTDLILVQALRQFLWSFRLPGEAQKIDRMMESFAQRYCHLNPNIFSNSDTCYVLSFAVIMLNTSLHNPSVKDKPSVEQFITMNRGINDGKDLPRDILESLYESIKAEPFKIPEDDGNDLMHTFFNPDREGWLWKQGGRYKSWKRRWFILNDNCLYYFEYTTDKEPRGIIPLENIQVREVVDRNKPNCFELFAAGSHEIIKACKTDSEGKVVEGKHTVYRMSAATPEEKESWIACIRQSISHNPFYDMLAARKKKAQKSGSRTKS